MEKSNKQINEIIQNPQNPLTSDITYPINVDGLRQCPFCNQFPKLKAKEPFYSANKNQLSRKYYIECDCGISFDDKKDSKYFVSVSIGLNGKVNIISTLDSLIEKWNKRDFSKE